MSFRYKYQQPNKSVQIHFGGSRGLLRLFSGGAFWGLARGGYGAWWVFPVLFALCGFRLRRWFLGGPGCDGGPFLNLATLWGNRFVLCCVGVRPGEVFPSGVVQMPWLGRRAAAGAG